MFPDTDVDPCEVYFRQYREVDGRQVPARVEVRHGDQLYALLEFTDIKFEEAPKEEKPEE